jgi:RND superfamily putative drug exporter
MTTRPETNRTAARTPRTLPFFGRYAAFVAGRRSKWVVLVFWLLLIAVAGSLASKIGSAENNDAQTWLPASAQSTRALAVAEQYFAGKDISTAVVVYARASGLTATDLSAIDADRNLMASRHAAGTISAVTESGDRKAAFISVPLRTSPSDNNVLGNEVTQLTSTARSGTPAGLEVEITGPAGDVADYIHIYTGLDAALLGGALAIVALFLLATYRSPVLWLVPLLSVGLASEIASGVVYLLAEHAGLTVNGESAYVLTILVLGVGTDYALLLIARYREELHRQQDRHMAMASALRRCLPAITASAATVAIATLCLLAGRMNSTRGLGPVVAIGIVVAFLAMTSLLPALLVILGRWLFWPFIPRYQAGHEATGLEQQHRFWARVSRTVGRNPRPLWIVTALVLAGLACGAFSVTTGQTQAQQFTRPVSSVTGQQLLDQHFPAGSSAPADVYVPAGGAMTALATVRHTPGITSASLTGSAGGWAHITAVFGAAPDTGAARQTVTSLRTALAAAPGQASSALVGGQSAVALDTSNAEAAEERLLIPVILAVVLVMLMLLLRALVAPVVLLLSVVLTYGAAVGAASLIFHALGHPQIDRSLFLFGFLFLVALGVDYTIFLMTRAREEVQRHGHRDGILASLALTGGVITSAGLVLAATFCVLAAIPTVGSLQEGLLIAVGVLLDTLLVRSLLVPALALDIGPRIWRPGHPEPADRALAREPAQTQRASAPASLRPGVAAEAPSDEENT